jgi:hypothetical protein
MVEPKLKAIQTNIHANNGFSFVVVVNSLLKSTNILVVSHGQVDIGLAQNELQGLFQNLQKANVE